MKKISTLQMTCLAFSISCYSGFAFAESQFTALTDDELAQVEAQSLLNLEITAPNQASPQMQAANIGFYKLSTQAEMELNVNIRKLQLGCGGYNGAGACDIDIDYLSLSGLGNTSDERASSSAFINNPFIEFAIKNPNAASTREVVGFRLSAEKVQGLLTTGLENTGQANGINRFSGYMQIQSGIGQTAEERSKLKGYANTAAAYMDLSKYPIQGKMEALGLATVDFTTNGGGFNIPAMNNLPFETDSIVINGNRQTKASLTAGVNIPTIYLGSGANYPSAGRVTSNPNDPYQTTTAVYTAGTPVNAVITACSSPITLGIACVAALPGREFNSIRMQGQVEGARAQVNFEEALGFVHQIQLNSAFSLSLQREDVHWPGFAAANIAKRGWWLSVADPVSIGEIIPDERLSIEPLLGQFAQQAGNYLQQNPAQTSDIAGVLTGNNLEANIGTIRPSTPLMMNLQDLKLRGQDFAPNCFGGYKFC